MKNHLAIFFILLAFLLTSQLEALKREYAHYGYSNLRYCLFHMPYDICYEIYDLRDEINEDLLNLIPDESFKCKDCIASAIYSGYIDPQFKKYLPHLKRQLEYYEQHADCGCLWPELSKKASQINDMAYVLFEGLISTTILSNLSECPKQRELLQYPFRLNPVNKHGNTISFLAQQFRFSDYYQVCCDIEAFAAMKYEEKEAAKIKEKLDDILEILYPKFLQLYTTCYEKHPHPDIDQEIAFIRQLVNSISEEEDNKGVYPIKPGD